jgi:hypothetical protein
MNANDETNMAALLSEMCPADDAPPLPLPRFGKVPESASVYQALPRECKNGDLEPKTFLLTWIDEEDLGIRVYIRPVKGPNGLELKVEAEGLRPELLGQSLSVAIAGRMPVLTSIAVHFDRPGTNRCACMGEGSFGSVEALRAKLGDDVEPDVFLLGKPET